ncbi:MAG: type II toxin-antitoxin system RelE/ParE family toxin [Alphaproteobacteria bacterium]|nr:type II toxin-antitoxin system RelE/ParE family toxin [Alphaproteobacteria bacterium]MDE2492466.1 type II toxin-antitoxin system RelE/ParE family toxin [Alphaproteobacteria bacterium]
MKELRFASDDGVWRIAFAFDLRRDEILLAAGDKSGGSEAKFYKRLGISRTSARWCVAAVDLGFGFRSRRAHDRDG